MMFLISVDSGAGLRARPQDDSVLLISRQLYIVGATGGRPYNPMRHYNVDKTPKAEVMSLAQTIQRKMTIPQTTLRRARRPA
ncbi:MAG: hypothetical protein V2A61_02430, partial [Calditrichota bacterium]